MVTKGELAKLCRIREQHGDQPGGSGVIAASFERFWVRVSAGRIARVSFGDYRWWEEEQGVSHIRAMRLLDRGHMSPYEHQAKPFSESRWDLVEYLQEEIREHDNVLEPRQIEEMCRQLEYSGNLHGWVPARKQIPNEWDYSLMKKGS